MSHPKLTNPSPYVHSTESYSDPKYDLNVTQPISTRRSKNLHELREKLSKYTLMFIQLLEGNDDFSLHVNFQSKYQTSYSFTQYGTWLSTLPMSNVGTKLFLCGNHFMISKSIIDVSNIGLFILSHVLIPPKQSEVLIPFCGPI